jgi:hypothetical protein
MAVLMITNIKNFIGLSTDTKPTTEVPPGSTFWAYDTGTMFKTYDGTNWRAYSENSVVQPGSIDLNQAANTYDLFTATGGSVYVEYFSITMPATPDVTNDATITSIAVVTDTTTVLTLLSAAAGAKANLVANTVFSYALPFTLPVGKKIRLTIAGGAADGATVCITSCRYRAINPAGYLA